MNAADTSANEPDQRSGLSTGGKCGLWACGGCAFVLAVAIVVSGVIAARWLTRNPETLSKLYGGQPIPQILIQPGGPVRMISDEWIVRGVVPGRTADSNMRYAQCEYAQVLGEATARGY